MSANADKPVLVFDVLNDVPYRNGEAAASSIGGYASMPGKWTKNDLKRLAMAGKIDYLEGPTRDPRSQLKYGNRQVQDIKNRREHYEMLLRSIPEAFGGGGFHKPLSWGDEWLTMGEVAGMLGCKHGTISRLIDTKQLQAEKTEVDPFYLAGEVVVEINRIHRRWLSSYLTAKIHRVSR